MIGETIWKFPFEIEAVVNIEMPEGAQLLHVGVQRFQPCIWAKVDLGARRRVHRRIKVFGTGHNDVAGSYLGTLQTHGGDLVWHIFDQGEFSLDT